MSSYSRAIAAIYLALPIGMLGSVMDAEDCLQEVFLRWQSHAEQIENPRAWLATVATRWCLDQLNTARHQREQYIGQWLPEPLITAAPSSELEQAESLSTAFLVLLERLSPAERAVFLLHKVFGYDYSEIGTIVGKSAAACRQLGHRASEHVAQTRPRFNVEPSVQQRLSEQFLQSCATGDLNQLDEFVDRGCGAAQRWRRRGASSAKPNLWAIGGWALLARCIAEIAHQQHLRATFDQRATWVCGNG